MGLTLAAQEATYLGELKAQKTFFAPKTIIEYHDLFQNHPSTPSVPNPPSHHPLPSSPSPPVPQEALISRLQADVALRPTEQQVGARAPSGGGEGGGGDGEAGDAAAGKNKRVEHELTLIKVRQGHGLWTATVRFRVTSG